MRVLLLALALPLASGCVRPVAAPASAATPAEGPAVMLERTVCFGTCPDYTVAAYADGRVVFDGRQFVARTGRAEWRVAPSVVAGLVAEAVRIGHARYPESLSGPGVCPQEATDNPTAMTTVQAASGRSHVVHYRGCQGFRGKAELLAFEDAIDRDLGTSAYVRTR